MMGRYFNVPEALASTKFVILKGNKRFLVFIELRTLVTLEAILLLIDWYIARQ
jgi:hypothetical protein